MSHCVALESEDIVETLTIEQVAQDLRLSRRSVQRLAQNNEIPTITKPFRGGFEYLIPLNSYLVWKQNRSTKAKENSNLSNIDSINRLKEEWIEWCKNGKLVGKPLSENTIKSNLDRFNQYLSLMPRRHGKNSIISLDILREVLSKINPKSFAIKDNIYKAVRSFTKFLIANNLAKEELLAELQKAKPKRVYPAKKLHCTLEQFEKLLEEAGKKYHSQSEYDVSLNVATIATIGFTGLRASELINLRLEDVDLASRKLFVYLGKGKKNRFVGISNRLHEVLFSYLKSRPKTKLENFFVTYSNLDNEPVRINRDVLLHKIKRLAKRVGFNINLHGLRRTFATVAANSGKPINIISLALGHSDLKTTQGYLMTTQDEVIKAMKSW